MKFIKFSQIKGFTVVELMVAVTISLLLLAGVVQIFVGTKQSFRSQEGLSRLQENARFAIDIMAGELRMAGYMGCASNNLTINNLLNDTPYEYDITNPLQGYEATGAGAWTPALGELPAVVSAAVVSGTDVLVTRQMNEDDSIQLAEPMPDSSAVVKVTIQAEYPFDDDDIILISDCQKASLFQVTNLTAASGTVVHNTGTGDPGNAVKNLTDDGSTYDSTAYVFTVETNIFYVAPGTGENNQGDNPLSLWRKVGENAPEEMIEGVEDMQILYGEDLDDDALPNRYVAADDVTDFAEVVTIRIDLILNSVDTVTVANNVITKTFSNTIKLRNRS